MCVASVPCPQVCQSPGEARASLWEQGVPLCSRLWTTGRPGRTSRASRATGDDRGKTESDGYLLDNRQNEAAERFDTFTALFDPTTFRHLEGLGIAPGRRCWEVGAGGTSVVSWPAEKAGPDGQVVATDIDTSRLTAATRPPVEVRVHDVGREEPPGEDFGLVHARLVLVHVPEREKALRSMINALRPDGRLLIEDADPALQPPTCPDEYGPEQRLDNRLRRGFRHLLADRGADLSYGRKLPRLLREVGLHDVQADAYSPVASPACTALEAATVRQVRNRLVAAGLATDAEIDRHLANVEAGTMDLATAPMISAWGRQE